jgi:hypothetical protein
MPKINRFMKTAAEFRYTVAILLALNLIIHLVVYFNTTMFKGISESGMLLEKLNNILAGERPLPIFGFYWYYTPSYIGYFFIKVFGSIHSYFIFQCLLGTITTYIVYRIVLLLSNSKNSGIFSIILMTIYVEHLLLSAVFYNQIYEVFFGSLFLLFSLQLLYEKKLLRIILLSVAVILSIYTSLLFRTTFLYAFICFLILSIIFLKKKDYAAFYKFSPIVIILILLIFVFKPINKLREGTEKQGMAFWGHTMYGGLGGENGFIFKKNEDLFNKKLKEYTLVNHIDSVTPSVIEKFQNFEVKHFITKEPHKWVFLQFKKFFYTFGAVPSRDALLMITTGKIKLPWWIASAIVQFPFVLLVFLFILTMDLNFKDLLKKRDEKLLIYLVGVYLVCGICFYATYSERYRPVVFVLSIIPIIAINIKNLKILFFRENRSSLYIRMSLLILFILIWSYQTYEAMVIYADRYFGALDKINQ